MNSVKHAAPSTIEGVCSLLSQHGERAAVLSGGQSLLPAAREQELPCDVLVDINGLEAQSYVEIVDGDLHIGCLARHVTVATSDLIRAELPVLAAMAGTIGDVQVRNQGTLCGALAEADPTGDPPVVALLLEAELAAISLDSERALSAATFFQDLGETALTPAEFVSEVRFPLPGADTGSAYERWTPNEGAYPVATVGVALTVEDTITDANIVVGSVEGEPAPMPTVADRLSGAAPTEEAFVDAARALGSAVDPVANHEGGPEFKREITTTLAKDALVTAAERAGV
jgi:carbon-monoxide dehydrogenase medium subunit